MSLAAKKPAGGSDPLAVYDYNLPAERIAQHPAPRRTQARMMVLPQWEDKACHQKVAHLTRWLKPGDLLVLNDTKVVPARLWGQKPTGGQVEILLLNPAHPLQKDSQGRELHEALIRSHRPLKPGARLRLSGKEPVWLELVQRGTRGRCRVLLPKSGLELAEKGGVVPLPPYIKRPQGPDARDQDRYQTVYAQNPGAVAAPTAGLHLDQALLKALHKRLVKVCSLTLHVGWGTFAEPDAQDLAAGRLHPEWVEIGQSVCRAVAQARAQGGRVIAVGTTSARALEWRAGPGRIPRPARGWCDLLIQEGRPFKVVDGLLTNFHLPRTTLLMLVSALAGRKRVLGAYGEAVEMGYRFYSFGDAMLII